WKKGVHEAELKLHYGLYDIELKLCDGLLSSSSSGAWTATPSPNELLPSIATTTPFGLLNLHLQDNSFDPYASTIYHSVARNQDALQYGQMDMYQRLSIKL
ncbi:hypothetical protein HAX54_005111, partial [Datura stramonium]|nr:hypothetical protein [Datura stramonium]